MTMVVKNNLNAIRTLNQVNKNTTSLKKNLDRLASGVRLISAQNDASSYAISRKMQAQIRALDQDQQNSQNARSLLKVAAGGIEDIVEELRCIKELAIDASNDSNTDKDRLIMQKELNQRKDTINDIATTTNYNGKSLLDGSCALKEILLESDTKALGTTRTVTITEDGVYDISSATSNQTIKIQAQNVKLVGKGTDLSQVKIEVATAGANLFIQEVHITNSNGNCIIFTGGGDNTLTILGDNELAATHTSYACVNVGTSGSLMIVEDEDEDSYFGNGSSLKVSAQNGAAIGSNNGTIAGSVSTADIIIKSGHIEAKTTGFGAAIGSGGANSIGKILISGGTVKASNNYRGTAIGAGYATNTGNSSVGDIEITGGTVTAVVNNTTDTSKAVGAAIGAGAGGNISKAGKILISGGTVTAETSGHASAIGAGYSKSSTGDIVISGGNVTAKASGTAATVGSNAATASTSKIVIAGGSVNATSTGTAAAIGSGNSSSANIGDIIISGGTVTANASSTSAAIGSGTSAKFGNISISNATVNATTSGSGAAIGGGQGSKTSNNNITIYSGTVTATVSGDGAAIGSGMGGGTASNNITIYDGTVIATTSGGGAAIGGGLGGTIGKLTIVNGTVNATSTGKAAAIGSGTVNSALTTAKAGNIEIYGGNVTANSSNGGAGIGSGLSSTASTTVSVGNIIVLGGDVTATSDHRCSAAIGCGGAVGNPTNTAGNIMIYAGNVTAKLSADASTTPPQSWAAAIGSGYCSSGNAQAGNIGIYAGTVDAFADSRGTAIGTAYVGTPNTSKVGNITINGGSVHAQTTGANYSTSSAVNAIGKYNGATATVGTISVNGTTYTTAVNDSAYNTPDKKNLTINLPDNVPSSASSYTPPSPSQVSYNIPAPSEAPETPENPFKTKVAYDATNALKFQTGTEANQHMVTGINDMHTTSLKNKIPSEDDNAQLQNLMYSQKAYSEFKAILDEAKDKSIDDISFVPRYNAQVAIRIIDGAIAYALIEASNVGAFTERLETTESNIETSSENLQAADSVINDTDMAKEMTAYTKNNVLLQASQSMLAQANQNSNQVLSLLQ